MSEITITENPKEYRFIIKAACHFGKVNVRAVDKGVKVTFGQVKGSNRMAIHNYIFDRAVFKSAQEAKAWLEKHVKQETLTAMDFHVFNEYRNAALRAYMEVSKIS